MSGPHSDAGAPDAQPRVGLALALCFAIFMLWINVVMPALWPPPPRPVSPPGPTPPTTVAPGPTPTPPGEPPVAPVPAPGPGPETPPRFPRTDVRDETTHTVHAGALDVTFSNRGGTVTSVTLAAYKNPEQTGPHVLLRAFESERPPLLLRLEGTGPQPDVTRVCWETVATTPDGATYAYATGDGRRLVKTFTVERGTEAKPAAHVIHVRVRLENVDAADRHVVVDLEGPAGLAPEAGPTGPPPPAAFVGYVPGTGRTVLERFDPATLRAGERPKVIERGERFAFAGVTSAYFVAVLVPTAGIETTLSRVRALPVVPAEALADVRAEAGRHAGPPPPDAELRRRATTNVAVACRHEATLPAAGASGPGSAEFAYDLVVGPKSSDLLQAFGLDALREPGWTDVLSLPMLALLRLFHAATGSYGIAIMLLTLLVRAVLHPLQFRMQLSMTRWSRKMKDVQPKLERIKKTITDPRRAQQEQMKVMREHGLRPPLGCLLPFLQMPVFIAIYQVFLHSVELRQATFLWIRDLTLSDRLLAFPGTFVLPVCGLSFSHLNLLPLIWIGLMQFQQKFSVVPLEEMTEDQRRQMQTMRWMTIVFGLMFYNWPAATGLYVLTSTSVGMGEQAWIRSRLRASGELPPRKPAAAPAAAAA